MKILICGDTVPYGEDEPSFSSGDTLRLLGEELAMTIRDSDYRIINLECPLFNGNTPIPKAGPNLSARTDTVQFLKAINTDIVVLANNHIMDHGNDGLVSTVETLDKSGIRHLGAGSNIEESSRPYIISGSEANVGIYACTEHEYSVAGYNKPGANPYDPLRTFDEVKMLKSRCDFVIVLFHGGLELYRYPSPNMQLICRKLADSGADLVITQHSHCIGCMEEYRTSVIIYGQGNFIFNRFNNEFWNSGLLVQFNTESDFGRIKLFPIVRKIEGVRLAEDSIAREIMGAFSARTDEIRSKGIVETNYGKLCNMRIDNYLRIMQGSDSYLLSSKIVNKIFKSWLRKKYENIYGLDLLNSIECESHLEVIITYLRSSLTALSAKEHLHKK